MPAVTLPTFDNLVQGDDYNRPAGPTDDAMSTEGASANQILGRANNEPSPLTPVSLATETMELPGNEQTWNSGDKGTDYMGGSTLPWQK